MRKPMCQSDQDWSDFATRGETESGIRCSVPVIVVDDSADDEATTLRMIEAALEAVESERPSGPDLETCLDSSRRSDFPAAPPVE